METLRAIRRPDSGAAQIAEVLSVDPGLSVRVLQLANSPAFSPNRQIENLSQAVALVGMSQLESLVLSAAAHTCLPSGKLPGYDMKHFWQVAVRRGVLAKDLSALARQGEESACFTAGILHDMAIPFLVQQRPDDYIPIIETWHREGSDLSEIERERFDWDHAEVATWICDAWNLPENIASAIGGHHADRDTIYACPIPVKLVAVLREGSDEAQYNAEVEELVHRTSEQFHLPEETTRKVIDESLTRANSLARLII